MGELADWIYDTFVDNGDDNPWCSPEDYLDLPDGELVKLSSFSRAYKTCSIRRWSLLGNTLSKGQRYVLAASIAIRDNQEAFK